MSEPIIINDVFLYEVTMVVAVPRYTTDPSDIWQPTAQDLICEVLGNKTEITVINITQKELEMKEKEQ